MNIYLQARILSLHKHPDWCKHSRSSLKPFCFSWALQLALFWELRTLAFAFCGKPKGRKVYLSGPPAKQLSLTSAACQDSWNGWLHQHLVFTTFPLNSTNKLQQTAKWEHLDSCSHAKLHLASSQSKKCCSFQSIIRKHVLTYSIGSIIITELFLESSTCQLNKDWFITKYTNDQTRSDYCCYVPDVMWCQWPECPSIHYTQISLCSLLDHDDYGIERVAQTNDTVSYASPASNSWIKIADWQNVQCNCTRLFQIRIALFSKHTSTQGFDLAVSVASNYLLNHFGVTENIWIVLPSKRPKALYQWLFHWDVRLHLKWFSILLARGPDARSCFLDSRMEKNKLDIKCTDFFEQFYVRGVKLLEARSANTRWNSPPNSSIPLCQVSRKQRWSGESAVPGTALFLFIHRDPCVDKR